MDPSDLTVAKLASALGGHPIGLFGSPQSVVPRHRLVQFISNFFLAPPRQADFDHRIPTRIILESRPSHLALVMPLMVTG
jgi:hypothetical protein